MSTRFSFVTLLAATLLLGGCASAPKYPVLGDWLVTSYTAPGTDLPSLDLLVVVGASATLKEHEIRFGERRCPNPTYTARSYSAAEFTAQFKVAPADVGLTSEPVETYTMACGDTSFGPTRVLIIKDPDTVLVPTDGTFYELTRRAVFGRR
jgi:hypothetical protein